MNNPLLRAEPVDSAHVKNAMQNFQKTPLLTTTKTKHQVEG